MAIATPRGLKIRLAPAYAFALLDRLHPKVTAFQVLQLTEALENLSGFATLVAAATCFLLRAPPQTICIAVTAARLFVGLCHAVGYFGFPISTLLPLVRVYGMLCGFGILFIAVVAFGYFTVGWQGVAAYVCARLALSIVLGAVSLAWGRHVFKQSGVSFTASERNFFNAFRIMAARNDASIDLTVDDSDIRPVQQSPSFIQLAITWPEVVRRFTFE